MRMTPASFAIWDQGSISSVLNAGKGNAVEGLILTDLTFLLVDLSHLVPALDSGSLAPLSVCVRLIRAITSIKRMNRKLLSQRSDYICAF